MLQRVIIIIFFGLVCGLANYYAPTESANRVQMPPPAPTPTPAETNLFWQGTSGNFAVKWTKDDITAKNQNGKEVFSVRRFALDRLKKSSGNFSKNNQPNFEYFNFGYRILAVVGTKLFLRETTSYSPQTYTNQSYVVVDLANPSAKIDLKSFFSQAEILAALDKNPEIVEDLRVNDIQPPQTFGEFFTAYDRPPDGGERPIDKCYFPKNFLESFYFDAVENDQAVVKLGVPCRVGMRSEEVYNLELRLPLKPSIADDLKNVAPEATAKVFKDLPEDAETDVAFDAKTFGKSK